MHTTWCLSWLWQSGLDQAMAQRDAQHDCNRGWPQGQWTVSGVDCSAIRQSHAALRINFLGLTTNTAK